MKVKKLLDLHNFVSKNQDLLSIEPKPAMLIYSMTRYIDNVQNTH